MTTLRNALGHLQNHPDDERAWSELQAELTGKTNGASIDAVKLLDAARSAHAERRESDAVARLLELEAAEVRGTSDEAPLLRELARVYDEELFDDARTVATCERLRALVADDRVAATLLEGRAVTRASWADLAKKDLEESKTATAAGFQSALLVSASEYLWRYGRSGTAAAKKKAATRIAAVEGFLDRAVTLDPRNRRGALLLERVLLGRSDWTALAALLERVTPDLPREQRVPELLRLARLYKHKLDLPEKAATAYASVIDLTPGQPEATSALVDFFTTTERWDELASLYEEHLLTSDEPDPGMILQVAMVNWRMRNKPDAAEPFFERLRRAQPGHQMALEFFRGYCREHGEATRLAQILADAERALEPGPQKSALTEEIGRLAQEGASATKAIEQNRLLLRQDANNAAAREALKRLYRQTASWNALADLLRGALERIDPQDAKARLPVLAEVAAVYREHIKSDSALVTVLSQIVQLAPDNTEALRELSRVYEQLGRWRDLLNVQTRLAELETRPAAKTELYRSIAKRWLDQFSNVQNASEALEKLLEVAPADDEAMGRLRELYTKRRAYRPLYELLHKRSEQLPPGPSRREMWAEMAKIAADRLERGGEAVYLYKRILEEEPGNAAALDALEKQAERDRDFPTVAEVIEKRIEFTPDTAQKMLLLQRLGAVYADRLQDQAGAARTWRRVLDQSPGNAKAMRVLRDSYLAGGDYDSLAELYAKGNDWEALAEVFSGAADRSTDAAVKVDLSFRAADVYATKLNAPERAFRAYERVLAARPDDARAAAALIPIYEKDEKWPRLPALYEIALRRAVADGDNAGQLELLGKLGQAAEKLQDRGGAFAYARRAYELAPTAPGALEKLEEAARTSGAFTELAATLAAASNRGEGQRQVRARLASTYANELGDVDSAVATYRELVEADERDANAMAALDKLLRAHDRRDDLRWLFALRVQRANTKHKLELLGEWALLEEEVFAAPDRAAAVFRRMLELVPNHGAALRALARLLRELGDSGGAVEALERDRDQRQGVERGARELEIARLYIGQLARPTDALAAVERALVCFAGDAGGEGAAVDPRGAVSVLEELLNAGETRATAARLLEGIYERSATRDRQAAVLEVMIATAAARGDRLRLFDKLATVKRSLDDHGGAFDVVARAAFEYPTELPLWDKLADLAQVTGRFADLGAALAEALPPTGPTELPADLEVKLAERAATLYLDALGDGDRAQPYLTRILARHPGDSAAFEKSKAILTAKERWTDVESLYERTMDAASDKARRVELLGELAIVAEEITGDTRKATRSYERILEVEPGQETASRALESLYTRAEDWPNLARLLTDRLERMNREGAATATARDALKRQLAHLYFERVGKPELGLELLEELLTSDVGDLDARDLAERALGRQALRVRAAMLLERVYAERNETRNLVRVLGVRLELATDAGDRRELLHRIAELRDEKLTDDAGAFDAYALYLPLAPDDSAARGRMLEIGRRTGALERAVDVLHATADAADAPVPRVEILGDLAALYETRLNDRRGAEDAYRTILVLDPDDPVHALSAAQALARIYLAEGKHTELAHMLRAQIRLEQDASERRVLLRTLAEISERELGNPTAAIESWKTRLEADPVDIEALGALDRLYERTSAWVPLVETLRARERLTDSPQERRMLMGRLAVTLAERLADREEAIVAYRALIEDFGADSSLLRALETLYAEAEQYPELAETLEAELLLTTDEDTQLALLTRLGSVRWEELSEVEGSLDAYRRALTVNATHAPSRAALESMLTVALARLPAAEILKPLYELDGAHGKLLRVLQVESEEAEGADRLPILAHAVRVAEGPLHDDARALGYALRGVAEAIEEPDLPVWLALAERLARGVGKLDELVALLRLKVADVVDGEVRLSLFRRIADLARVELQNQELAVEYYIKALEVEPNDAASLESLESLYQARGEWASLIEIIARRADAAESDREKFALLVKQAVLSDQRQGDKAAAIRLYEAALELEEDAEVYQALERLYAETERWGDLLGMYERQLGSDSLATAARTALLHKRGTVRQQQLADLDGAFAEYEGALSLDPLHPATIASLEALLVPPSADASAEVASAAAHAAELLETVYLARSEWHHVLRTLEVRLAASQDPEERRALLRRIAKLQEEQEENYKGALETFAGLLAEDVGDESTWADLERLSRVANAEKRLAEIYSAELEKIPADDEATATLSARTGELFTAQRDFERALVFFRRAYDFAPEDDTRSFAAIDGLLETLKRPADRVLHYRGSLEHRHEPDDRVRALQTIARLEDEELGQPDAAIVSLRAAHDLDDADPDTLDTLSALYVRRERWRDLSELLTRRAEQSVLPEDEARYRLELGLLLEKHGAEIAGAVDKTAALDQFQAVVEIEAGVVNTASVPPSAEQTQATARLESYLADQEVAARVIDLLRPVYERTDAWQKLAELSPQRIELATSDAEKAAIHLESARLWETRGNDPARALADVRAAFVLDPEDGALREELDRLATATASWDALVQTYEEAAAKVEGPGKRELYAALAAVHDKRRDDPRSALHAWDRLFSLDESDPEPLAEMESLATLLSDWSMLARVLSARAELSTDDEERGSLWRRVGEARRDMLDDAPGAIAAYERALDVEPDSALTLDYLIPLHEDAADAEAGGTGEAVGADAASDRRGHDARLVELYRLRGELAGEDEKDLQKELLVKAATRHADRLGEPGEAMNLLLRAKELAPEDRALAVELDRLYTAGEMWTELLESLREQMTRATPAEARALERQVAEVQANRLSEPGEALETLERVFAPETAPTAVDGPVAYDEAATKLALSIAEQHEELRGRVAKLLEPVLRAAGQWSDLIVVLEMRLGTETLPVDRAVTAEALAQVVEAHGAAGDAEATFAAWLRVLPEDPTSTELHRQLHRVAEPIGADAWRRYADAVEERAASIFEPKVASELYLRLGELVEEKLHDDLRASKALALALEQSGDAPGVLAALDRLYGRLEDTRALGDILERRIALENDAPSSAYLNHRLAMLHLNAKEPARAIAPLRAALERVPEHQGSREALESLLAEATLFEEVAEALEKVYRSLGRAADLAALQRKRVEHASGSDKTQARRQLARTLESDCGDTHAALLALEEALAQEPADLELLAEIERLAASTDSWAGAADALKGALGERGAADLPTATRAELWGRLAGWYRDRLADAVHAEEALTRALTLDGENLETVRALEAIRRAPGRERDRIEALRTIARLELAPEARRDALREAFVLAEAEVHSASLAEEVLRQALEEDDSDAWALEELTRLRDAAGDMTEVVVLLERRAAREDRPEIASELRRRAAEAVLVTGDAARAVRIYEEVFEASPEDEIAASRLRQLYEAQGRERDLARLLERQIDAATSPDARTRFRVELARLQGERFGAPRDAAITLRAILDEEPGHLQAAATLADLLEGAGDYEDLAVLLGEQIEAARERADAAAEVAALLRQGSLYEGHLGTPAKAREAYDAALDLDPAEPGALASAARLAVAAEDWAAARTRLNALFAVSATDEEKIDVSLRLAEVDEKLGDSAGAKEALLRALSVNARHREVRGRLRALYTRTRSMADLADLLVGDAELVRAAAGRASGAPPPMTAPTVAGGTMPPPTSDVKEEVALLREAADIHRGERKEPSEAVPLLERAASLVPGDRELLLLLCDTYIEAQRERDAADVLLRIIASFGGKRSKELALYHNRLGRTLARLGDHQAALAQLDLAFKIDPGSISVLKDLGVLALEAGDLERAQKTFRALLLQKLDPQSGITKGEVFYYLGEASARQGDKTKAQQMFERAVENEPGNARAKARLAEIKG